MYHAYTTRAVHYERTRSLRQVACIDAQWWRQRLLLIRKEHSNFLLCISFKIKNMISRSGPNGSKYCISTTPPPTQPHKYISVMKATVSVECSEIKLFFTRKWILYYKKIKKYIFVCFFARRTRDIWCLNAQILNALCIWPSDASFQGLRFSHATTFDIPT